MSEAQTTRRAAFVTVGAFVEELVRAGVRHFCVCPGSRSTPLALTIARHPGARAWTHLDERSAGFFGLGLAKALREPVALVCTSGTAAANFLPAVAEAFHSRVPLIVLTADRPRELREVGAPQTMDQVRLYGSHAKWFMDMPEPDERPDVVRYTRAAASRAVAIAREAPAGPVHLNCPYREPLVPLGGVSASLAEESGPVAVAVSAGPRAPATAEVARLADAIRTTGRGLIVCGPQDDPALAEAASRLAALCGYPLLADPLSGARTGPHTHRLTIGAYDAFLRDESFSSRFAPELVLRLGAMPVSKPLLLYLQRHRGCRTVLVDGGAGWADPGLLATEVLHVDGRLLCEALTDMLAVDRPPPSSEETWAHAWRAAERAAVRAIGERLGQIDEPFEGRAFAELAGLLPAGATLLAGNSMPIRDLDSFFPVGGKAVRLMGNRGVNGIDGVVSTALGAAAAGGGPIVLAIGDISFYHDSNGLLAARRHGLSATIVLLNNDGGGIFSFLPQALEAPEHFEELFGTPHGLDFRPIAELYGARYTLAEGWGAFRDAVRAGIEGEGLHIVELRTDRDRNVALHRAIWPAVSEALAAAVGAGDRDRRRGDKETGR